VEHYAWIDVSLERSCVFVVDGTGRIVREAKVASEPEVLVAWFCGLGLAMTQIGRGFSGHVGARLAPFFNQD
jgi:transposase